MVGDQGVSPGKSNGLMDKVILSQKKRQGGAEQESSLRAESPWALLPRVRETRGRCGAKEEGVPRAGKSAEALVKKESAPRGGKSAEALTGKGRIDENNGDSRPGH